MKSFLKYTLATITGVIISTFLISIILLGILGVMISSQDKPVHIKSNSVLHLKINQAIPDRSSVNALEIDFLSFELIPQLGLNDILENLEKAKKDDKIKGVFLEFGFITPGIATMEEIRDALNDFKSSGKFIVAYSNEVMSHSAFYMATVADKIYLNPVAIFEFMGLRSEVIYYKGALEKLGIDIQIVRHGEYKSAVEPYIRENMSIESRDQIMSYMGSIWEHMLEVISEARNIPVDELNRIADELLVRNPQDALNLGLVDAIKYQDEVLDDLLINSGLPETRDLNLVSFSKYSKVPKIRDGMGLAKNKIAIVYATGVIGFASKSEYNIGGPTFVKAIRAARKDSAIKAIVLRVNSPGGSAMVSEHIWREVQLAQNEKPVIASMGNVAASGGYYIVAPAEAIFCEPTSITGSIGVFGLLPNAEKLLNQKLGITFDVAKTNKYSDFGSIYRPLKPMEREYLQAGIEKTYSDFISKVGKGRNMQRQEVDRIGQGRVWSGINALEIGLADQFGGLNAAVEYAAASVNMEHYRIVSYPQYQDPFEKLIKTLSGDIQTRKISKEMGVYYQYFEDFRKVLETKGPQMRMPFRIDIF